MDKYENQLYRFWAKTSHDKDKPNAFHPLICHLIDVAAVTLLMWHKVLPTATKRRIAEAFGLEKNLDAENEFAETGKIVAFIAGLHDLGKCSPPFALRKTTQNLNQIYNDTSFSLERHQKICTGGKIPKPLDAPHGFVTAAELPEILQQENFGASESFSKKVAELIGGHHGVFAKDLDEIRINDEKVGGKAWRNARKDLTLALANVLKIPLPLPKNAALDNAETMLLAGLVSVADWIGSNAAYFECRITDFSDESQFEKFDVDEYLEHSKKQAETALRELGWLDWQTPQSVLPFEEMFPFQPRRLQTEAVKIAKNLESPGIVVIEAPMGEGKTEAAVYLADVWNYRLKQRGCYFALPTQATSNQMFGRIVEFLKKRFPNEKGEVSIQLLHGHAALNPDLDPLLKSGAKILRQQDIFDEQEIRHAHDECTPAVIAGEWFTYRKRGLLAPFGVGTIDQSLLAVLQTKHVFVRLFGLANKTVIVDEVHAYDAYMSTLLERLLEWLAALGSPVVLLSATLPKERRNKLTAAYLKGFGIGEREFLERIENHPNDSYPRISWAMAKRGEKNFDFDVAKYDGEESNKTLRLHFLDGFLSDETKISELAARLKEVLRDGGCAAVICNTVGRAQTIYEKLREYFLDDDIFGGADAADGESVLDLLHARFLFKDRDEREKRALIRFGKEDGEVGVFEKIDGEKKEKKEPVKRPTRAILVSTQIIEQSLDLDFDLLVTDLAPADLILQRAGRLHRHEGRTRPKNLEQPNVWIMQPEISESRKPDFGVSRFVYAEHILLRSWLELQKLENNKIEIPGDVENLIEAVYDEKKLCPENATEAVREFWQTSFDDFQTQREKDASEAKNRWLKRPSDSALLWRFTENFYAEDSPELHEKFQALTRLAEPSVTVICLYGTREAAFFDDGKKESADYKKPTLPVIRDLLRNSVTVSGWKLVKVLQCAEETKPAAVWLEKSLLRNCRLLFLGEKGEADIGDFVFRVDKYLGVTAAKKTEKEEKI